MAKRPSFQFYPGDWRNNAKLRRCSDAARGAWVDILCILHDEDEYGIARYPLAELARAATVPLKLVKELATKGVLKGSDKEHAAYIFQPRHAGKLGEPVILVAAGEGPCWYCSRFVRDEWIRLRRGQTTQFSSENQPPKGSPKIPFGDGSGDGPSSPSSSSVEEKKNAQAEIEVLPDRSLWPETPKHAPRLEDVQAFFYRQGMPQLTEPFMNRNAAVGWMMGGQPITNWMAAAAGYIRTANADTAKAAEREAKAKEKLGRQSNYVPTERDNY